MEGMEAAVQMAPAVDPVVGRTEDRADTAVIQTVAPVVTEAVDQVEAAADMDIKLKKYV